MNRSFVLGALIFAAGVSVGVALERNKNIQEIEIDEKEDTIHGIR